jgi:hypothetical protein
MSEIARLADEYEKATRYFESLAEQVAEKDLDNRHPDGWSARQVIHHLADSEAQSYARLRRLVAEPAGSIIQGYDENLWAANPILGYNELPIEESMKVFSSVRAASLTIFRRLADGDLERWGDHTERGRITIRDWHSSYSKHPLDHAEQLERAVRGDL